MRRAPVAAVLLVLAAPTGAQDWDALPVGSRFDLFNDCRPMRLIVEGVSEYAVEIGLTESDLRRVAESRLRSARIYTQDMDAAHGSALYVNCSVVGPAYNVTVDYMKLAMDEFGVPGRATTWTSGSTGTHGGNEHYIAGVLAGHMDKFLVEYLRANEEACEAR